jgi:hypothetical protein
MDVSALPQDFLTSVNTTSPSAIADALKSRKSLSLEGTTLTVGKPGDHQSATLVANTLTFHDGARIVTNGNNLSIIVNTLDLSSNGGINSFIDADRTAAVRQKGLDGGTVDIYVSGVVGAHIEVFLGGQNGGPGASGGPGGKGTTGDKGSDSSSSAIGCSSGGGNGARGGQGGQGGHGENGKPGGNGGNLTLRAEAIKVYPQHFSLSAPGGSGGEGGSGGAGGPGGDGGAGGNGSAFCGGGAGGPQGPQGPQGTSGDKGADGTPTKDISTKVTY